jgi:hypothetical protein
VPTKYWLIGALLLLWVALPLFWFLLAFTLGTGERFRARRRGGYVKPPASLTSRAAATPLRPERETTVYTSSRSVPGDPLAGSVILAARAQRSKPTALGFSGKETAARGESGVRRGSAA